MVCVFVHQVNMGLLAFLVTVVVISIKAYKQLQSVPDHPETLRHLPLLGVSLQSLAAASTWQLAEITLSSVVWPWLVNVGSLCFTTFIACMCCCSCIAMTPPMATTSACRHKRDLGQERDGYSPVNDYSDVEMSGTSLDLTIRELDCDVDENLELWGVTHSFVALERRLPRWEQLLQVQHFGNSFHALAHNSRGVGGGLSSISEMWRGRQSPPPHLQREVFCLELACTLMEVSYQSYFRPPPTISRPGAKSLFQSPSREHGDESHEEARVKESVMDRDISSQYEMPLAGEEQEACGASGPVMDLTRLGLHLVETFANEETSTFGLIGMAPDRLVISFRGSKNVGVFVCMCVRVYMCT